MRQLLFPMRLITCLLLALVLPGRSPAQNLLQTPKANLTEPDQELDLYGGKFKSIHLISAKMRGVRAANQTTYWVSADNRHLAAYQAGKSLWLAKVVVPFKAEIPTIRIHSLVLSSKLIFVRLSPRGMAEVDRKSGRIVARYLDRDLHNLKVE